MLERSGVYFAVLAVLRSIFIEVLTNPRRASGEFLAVIDDVLSTTVLRFAGVYGCMLVVPGPNALVVLQSTRSRVARGPVWAAAGVAFGAALAATVAASSARMLPQGPAFRLVGSLIIAAILVRAALRIWQSSFPDAGQPEQMPPCPRLGSFLLGLGTALSNPVSVPFFAAFFATNSCSPAVAAVICATVFGMAGAWFACLGLAGVRLHGASLPPAVRRLANPAMALVLIGMAVHQLWVGFAA